MAAISEFDLYFVKHSWGVYEQNSIVNSVRVDDWTTEWKVIASNFLLHEVILVSGTHLWTQWSVVLVNGAQKVQGLVNVLLTFKDDSFLTKVADNISIKFYQI